MKLAIFFRPSQTELYIATNDLLGNRNSVEIKSIKLSAVSSVGTDIDKAYNIFSEYINKDTYTVYASLFKPSIDTIPTYWNEDKPSNVFINDTYFSIFSLIHKIKGLTPTFIISSYSYCLIGADLDKYFNNELLKNIKHKPKTFHKICYDKPNSYKFSKTVPKETYDYIKNNSITFPWLDHNLKEYIRNLPQYTKVYYKILISTLVWAESKFIYNEFKENCQGQSNFGFSTRILYYHAQKLLEYYFNKHNKTEDDEVIIADIQVLLVTRFALAANRKKLPAKLIEWNKQYMPNHPIYVSKLSKYISITS